MAKTPVMKSSIHTDLFAQLPILQEATTSRVVVNNDVLRFVLFSFDAGQLLTEHASPRAVIVQLLSGAMEFTVAGETKTLHAGDIVYLAPGDRHALVAVEACHLALTMVDVDATKFEKCDGGDCCCAAEEAVEIPEVLEEGESTDGECDCECGCK